MVPRFEPCLNVEIAGRAKTLDESHRPCVCILHLKPSLFDEEGGYHAVDDAQDRRHQLRLRSQHDSKVEVKFNTARVVSRISYDVAGFEKPIYDQEILTFRRINDRWVIAGGVNPNLF